MQSYSQVQVDRLGGIFKGSVLRKPEDLPFVFLAGLLPLFFLTVPSFWMVAIAVWWGSNTIAHYFIHRPFFRTRGLNDSFALYMSVVLSIPQALWRDRHLAHHAEVSPRVRWNGELIIQLTAIAALWTGLLLLIPHYFWGAHLPGLGLGLVLCQIHGHFEHVAGTTSHYGALYNALFFNDGYHVEHHRSPSLSWQELALQRSSGARTSAWPAPMRWIEWFSLETLERMTFSVPFVQRWLLKVHARAIASILLPRIPADAAIGIVGGGLFPRTALVLRHLFPEARLTIIDANAANIRRAHDFLSSEVEWKCEWFDPSQAYAYDVLIIPLALRGDRGRLYAAPPAPKVLIHDWVWRKKGGAVVSWWLLKRINIVER